jgi:hypothetical protein
MPLAGRLSLGALGLALVVAVSAAWATSAVYLLARTGINPRIQISLIDGVHVYVGLVGGAFVIAKVLRVGLRHHVPGVTPLSTWHRWVSWSLLAIYAAIFATGVLLLLPIHGKIYGDLLNLHMLTSVWGVPPTTWHVWHYRKRARPYLTRLLPHGSTIRLWAALVLVLSPTIALLAYPRAVSQLSKAGGGDAWAADALSGKQLDAIAPGPFPGSLAAGGDGLYVRSANGKWTNLPLPAKARVTSLVEASPDLYVGTNVGVMRMTGRSAPVPTGLQNVGVNALAWDPTSGEIWAASAGGAMRSGDRGRTWHREAAGMNGLNGIAAIAVSGRDVYVSDPSGVYRWQAVRWQRQASTPDVTTLVARPEGGVYLISSMEGVLILDARGLRSAGTLAFAHQHSSAMNGHPDAHSVATTDGRLYAAGTANGVSVSTDGGLTWMQLGGGLGSRDVHALASTGPDLWAATSDGVYRFPIVGAKLPEASWWLLLLGAALFLGAIAALLGAAEWPRGVRRERSARGLVPRRVVLAGASCWVDRRGMIYAAQLIDGDLLWRATGSISESDEAA